MSNLVIVESPSKAKTLKNYLGTGYEVIASKGHVRDLPAAKLCVDIKNDFAPKYTIVQGKEALVKELKAAVKDSDMVYLATDPDREGEAISWHLAEILGLDLSAENRVTFNEITKTGVKNGMANPRKVDMDLVNAQQARRILDRLVGYTLSPFVSQKIRRGLSAGRVQSVAVKMIVDRENEITAFVPEEYWKIEAKFSSPKVINAVFYGNEEGQMDLHNESEAQKVLNELDGALYYISSFKKGTRKKQPQPPFITSTLQQEASRKLGFRPEKTMKIAQELYEGVSVEGFGTLGLITYMRTDSLRISDEARSAASEFITEKFGSNYLPDSPRTFKQRKGAQDGHEAIRPSVISITPEIAASSLSSDQFKLYSLIWKRFIASMMAAQIQNTSKLEIRSTKSGEAEEKYYSFTSSGYSVKFDGFTAVYETDEEKEDKNKLPEDLSANSKVKLKSISPSQHFTQPPARYTEESLIKTLEENGVGRPSTYASIVSTIIKREYVLRKQKQLMPTELGTAIVNLLKDKFKNIVNVKFTAQMETNLDLVGEGKEDYIKMLHDFYDDYELVLKKAKEEMTGVKIQLKEDITNIPCEKCGRMMVVKVGRFGKFLACPGYPECKTTKPYVVETDAKCPICAGKVISKKSKKGYTFFGCEKWPECQFMTWDKPTDEICPKCGKSLFLAKGNMLTCLDEKCGYQTKGKPKGKG